MTLIAGPVGLPTPKGVKRVDIESARELQAALRVAFKECDALFMAAAVIFVNFIVDLTYAVLDPRVRLT